ncbi:hypothetical protein Tco_1182087 [Tanacetum coccineum]
MVPNGKLQWSIRLEGGSACCSRNFIYTVSGLHFSLLETKPDDSDELCVDHLDLPTSSSDLYTFNIRSLNFIVTVSSSDIEYLILSHNQVHREKPRCNTSSSSVPDPWHESTSFFRRQSGECVSLYPRVTKMLERTRNLLLKRWSSNFDYDLSGKFEDVLNDQDRILVSISSDLGMLVEG